jgi:glycosyltransferase involved in cell wall biosynthesis
LAAERAGADALVVGVDARELQGRPMGTGRYLRNLLRQWREGPDRFVLYFNGSPPGDRLFDSPRVRLRPLGDRPMRGLAWQQRVLPAAAHGDSLDVFFSPAYSCPLPLHVPRVTAVHDLSFFSLPQDFGLLDGVRRRLLVAASVRVSRSLLACSAFTARELGSRFPDARDKVVTVWLGADDDLLPPPSREAARARLGLTGPFVVTVGAILNRRRLPELLRALARLRARRPDLVLDVVGENRTHPRLDLRAMADRLGLGAAVRLSGFVDEAGLADRYAAADAAVFLSDYEGFGLPAVEAAARGVPLLASRRPSLGEIVGEAALAVEPEDETGIAAALDRLLGDPALRADLIRRGRALAARYSWAEAAARTRDVLARAAGV